MTTRISPMLAALAAFFFSGFVPSAIAQRITDIDPRPGETAAQTEMRRVEIVTRNEAKTLAKANNPAGAETALVGLNRAPPNSAHWRFETARRLVHVAQDVVREGSVDASVPLISRALQHLREIEQLPANPGLRASAKAMIAYLQERYLGDSTAAKASYEEASLLLPETAGSAREASTRLHQEAEFRKSRQK